MAVHGIKMIISKRAFLVLWIASLATAMLAWYSSAKQAGDAAKDKRDLQAIFRSIHHQDSESMPTLPDSAPPWLRTAYGEIGQTEISGIEVNPSIKRYFAAVGDGAPHQDDQDDWASAFVEWCLQKSGKSGPRSNDTYAWVKWSAGTLNPKVGDVVVLNFSGLSHVGFYFGPDGDFIRVLGGNENDGVRIFRYPRTAVISFRSVE